MQGKAGDFGRVNDTGGEHVDVFAAGSVVAFVVFAGLDAIHDDSGLNACVGNDGAQRVFHRAAGDVDADLLVVVFAFEVFNGFDGADESNTTAGDDAFFNGSAGGVQRVFNAVFFLFHLNFGRSAHFDDGNATRQFGDALLQFFAVVIGGGFFDLRTDAGHAGFDFRGVAAAADDGGVFFADDDTLGGAEDGHVGAFQGHAQFFRDDLAVGEDGDVFEHGFATVAEARRLDGGDFDDAAHAVDNQGSERFAFDVFSNNQQWFAGFGDAFENRQQVADVGDFLVVQQDVGRVQLNVLVLRVVDEVGREVAAVKLHAFDDFERVFQALAFFDGNHAFFADFFHRFGDFVADGAVRVGGDGADLRDFLVGFARLGHGVQRFHGFQDGLVDTAFDVHRVHAGGNGFQAFADDGLREDGGGGGTVAGDVVSLGGDFFHHLRAHVLELVFQLDFLGNRNAVFGDGRRAEGFFEDDVTAFRAEGDFDGIGEDVHAFEHFFAGGFAEADFFS